MSSITKSPQQRNLPEESKSDFREQLFNGGDIGPIEKIQVSTERIVQLNGIMFDLDPGYFRSGPLLPKIPKKPKEFYQKIIEPMLNRHPVLAKCEVRMTGTGIHAILWLDSPVSIETDGDRERWVAIVQVVQAALPIDPDQPGITATTRSIGSINSKNEAKVARLKKGTPVPQEEVVGLYEQICSQPFKTIMQILTGESQMSPCPVCGDEKATLQSLDHVGKCYGSCGTVMLDRLYDVVLAPRHTEN